MLVDHMPVLAANLVYNVGVTRSTEAAANEVRIAKIYSLLDYYLVPFIIKGAEFRQKCPKI